MTGRCPKLSTGIFSARAEKPRRTEYQAANCSHRTITPPGSCRDKPACPRPRARAARVRAPSADPNSGNCTCARSDRIDHPGRDPAQLQRERIAPRQSPAPSTRPRSRLRGPRASRLPRSHRPRRRVRPRCPRHCASAPVHTRPWARLSISSGRRLRERATLSTKVLYACSTEAWRICFDSGPSAAVEVGLAREPRRAEAVIRHPDLVERALESRNHCEYADRARDRRRRSDDPVRVHGNVVPAGRGDRSHRGDDRLAGGAQGRHFAAYDFGRHDAAARAVDAQYDGREVIVLSCLAQELGQANRRRRCRANARRPGSRPRRR